jgi:hypothetical protein
LSQRLEPHKQNSRVQVPSGCKVLWLHALKNAVKNLLRSSNNNDNFPMGDEISDVFILRNFIFSRVYTNSVKVIHFLQR